MQTRQTFDSAFAHLRGLVEALRNDGNTAAIDKALKWLGSPDDSSSSSLYARRHKWALCFTGVRLTRGCDSSQFTECYFSGEPSERVLARSFAFILMISPRTPSSVSAPALHDCAPAPCCSVTKRAIGFKKANYGLYELSRRLVKLAEEKAYEEDVKREKEMFAEAARSIKGNPAFLVDLRKRVKATARAIAIVTAQTSRVLEYGVVRLSDEEDISERFQLWMKDDVADSLATAACQGASDAQMLHEGITRDSISHLLRAQPPRELDDESDAAAPAAASDDGPRSTIDGAFGDRAPGERSPSGGAPGGDADAPSDEDEPQPHTLPPHAGGASDDGAPALSADGCVRASAPPYASLFRVCALCARHTPSQMLALTCTVVPLCSAQLTLRDVSP